MIGFLAGIAFFAYDSIQDNDDTSNQATRSVQAAASPSAMPTFSAMTPTAISVAAVSALDRSYLPIEDTTLFIPSIAVQTPIIRVFLDGTSWDVSGLGMNVGHLQGTNWIKDGGNTVVSGHVEMRDGRAGVFADLGSLQSGDRVLVRQGDEEIVYSVTEIFNTSPDDLTPLYPASEDRLTLITCDDYNFFSDSYQERTIVVAERVS